MLVVVGDEVVEGETIVDRDEIDALFRLAHVLAIDVRAAGQALGERGDAAVVGLDEAAHVVAELAVPFLPGIADEGADLVESRRIPGFGDQLDACQRRVRLDVPDDRRVGQRLAVFPARQHRGQVEAETVDVHLLRPVAQAVEDQPAHDRMAGIERVAAAGVVGIAGLVGGIQHVVHVVGEAAEAQGGAVAEGLGGVVVDHVEDHLDAGLVQRLDHVAELVQHGEWLLARAVRGVRCKEGDGLVAPVVDQAGGRGQGIELVDRQQFHRRDAEILQVGDLLDQPGVGAALLRRHTGAGVTREAADVHLVDHRRGERAGATAGRPPNRRRLHPPRRSSWPWLRCRLAGRRLPGHR